MFTVRWKKSAVTELTAIWVEADSVGRQAITQAVHHLEQRLRVDPHSQGESRPQGRRIVFVPPLGLLLRVNDEESIVRILQVWQY